MGLGPQVAPLAWERLPGAADHQGPGGRSRVAGRAVRAVEEAAQGREGAPSLHRIQPDLDPELWGSLPPWRDDRDVVRGIDRQRGDQQADGQEAVDAVD